MGKYYSPPPDHRLVLIIGPEMKKACTVAAHGALMNTSKWARGVLQAALDEAKRPRRKQARNGVQERQSLSA